MHSIQTVQRALAVAGAAIALSSCATIIEGTSQEIMVSTNPSGASCVLERQGQQIAVIGSTPASTIVKKTKHDITIKCNKEGFEEAVYLNHSGLESGAVAGNVAADLLLTAGLSSIIDSASGADNKYTSPVNVTLIPKYATAPAAPAPVAVAPAAAPPAAPKAAAAPAAPTAAAAPAALPAGTVASKPVAD